jgi:hypothetical protein
MSFAPRREKVTILWLMVVTAGLGVVIRGFLEAPHEAAWNRASRIVDRSKMLRDIAKEDAETKKWEASKYPQVAEHHREKAEGMRKILQAKPPDSIGHLCYMATLFLVPLLIAAIVGRGVIHLRRLP